MDPARAATADDDGPRRSRIALVVATAILAALALLLGTAAFGPAEPASAAVAAGKPVKPPKPGGSTELEYAAVGDSFAAGVGGGSYLDTSCYRSANSYPRQLDADANKRLVSFPACTGASTVETLAQIATISTTAKVVTVTVGGNDVGFSNVMRNCFAFPSDSCQSSIDAGAAIAASQAFRDKVAGVITAIRTRTEPDAKVIVAGYPLLFHLNSSGVNTRYQWADEVNAETVVLNNVIESVAVGTGATFVDVEDDFAGHGIGSGSSWIVDWMYVNWNTAFHPTATGYAAYANAIRAVPVP
ncbi:GDSL-like Lipase/Acylhydrolase family protein [Agromyces flavus]|uniref:GDSL-like Lipase/Acylhydrolase family protein n=1 Tax=Agromyces flavus TaxID=589382 RepID=A0A1H1V1K6_9MICO|nr:GDSL-like Lipase/Acylhydrolase family protein [Agromyces flavus]